jgi:hypothetical protein
MANEESASEKAAHAIGAIRDGTLILAGFLFFVGFCYMSEFFGHFGIRVSVLDLGLNDVIVSSYNVVSSRLFGAGLAVSLFASGGLFRWAPRRAAYAGCVILACALLPYSRWVASRTAIHYAVAMRRGYYTNPIRLTLATATYRQYPRGLREANAAGRLRIIAETKDAFFLLDQIDTGRPELPIGQLYEVRRPDVMVAAVEVPNAAKEGP